MGYLLIVDDNEQIADVLNEYAKKEGYQAIIASDGQQALEEFAKREYQAILLDVMMPKIDGFEVCRQIRKQSMVPVIMITARGEDYERIMGLDIGADDYVVKPFSPSEVMARLRAVLRRITPVSEVKTEVLKKANLIISLEKFQVTIGQEKILLTKKETEILWLLASNEGKVFTRDNILDSVWGMDYYGDDRVVDSHIRRLRAKLDKYHHPSWNVSTVRGVGYRFEVSSDNPRLV